MDMRQFISQRLNEIKSISEKDLLRDILENIFIPLYDHTESQYKRIERRVKEEMPLSVCSYTIWSTVFERNSAFGGCPYLFPMLEDDMSNPTVELHNLQERLDAEHEIRLETVFMQADYLVCKEIDRAAEIFRATLKTETGDIKIGIRLRHSKRYLAKVESLYKLFIANNIPWQTINAPYMFKMFDVMLVSIDSEIAANLGTVSSYDADFGRHTQLIQHGFVPVWNVRQITMKSADFPLAALDKVNFEYVFDLSEEGSEHGYLADLGNADISAVRRERENLVVTSPAQKDLFWNMYKVMKRTEYETEYFRYELFNNAPDGSFAARMVAYYGTVIRTNAELHRLIAGYEVSEYMRLESVQVVQGAATGETYDVNSFLNDEIRDSAISKSLLFKFKPLKSESFIHRDVMSFLVSQMQLVYPEFHCVGMLV